MRIHNVLISLFVVCLPVAGTAGGCPEPCRPNQPPVSDAGPDQVVPTGSTVELNGSGTSDADGDTLKFHWVLRVRPTGSQAVLDNHKSVMPRFVADLPGRYEIDLLVHDWREFSDLETVVVTTGEANTPPVANAGADRQVPVGATAVLDGSASSDVDGDVLGFAWRFDSVPAGSQSVLLDPASVRPSFVPDLSGSYVARLTVDDGHGGSSTDTVEIQTVPGNRAPVANAGPDQAVTAGQTAILDGRESSDPDGDALQFRWSFVSRPDGSNAALDSTVLAVPRFVADRAGDYVLQLVVSDGALESAADTVLVTSDNTPPVAVAGEDVIAEVGEFVRLDGDDSHDANGDPLAFTWSLLARPAASAATLADAFGPTPGITVDASGLYVVQLIVNDGLVDSLPDNVVIDVPAPPDPEPDGVVSVITSDETAGELGPESGAFTISRTGPTDEALTVHLQLLGSATNGTDYQALPTSVTIPAGASSVVVTVTPIQDTVSEGAESVLLFLSPGSGYEVGTPGISSLSIADSVVVSASAPDAAASEADLDAAYFEITRTGDLSQSLLIQISLTGAVNALNSNDAGISGVVGGSLVTIPAGAASARVTVTPNRDNRAEGDEDLVLTVVRGNAYVVGNESATIILADDPAIITVGASDAQAAEATLDPGAFTFARSGGDINGTIVVRCNFGGSTASPGLDFTPATCGITIPAGATSATLSIVPRADAANEGSETVVANVLSSNIGAYVIGTPSQATVTIAP